MTNFEQFRKDVEDTWKECSELNINKHHDYGPNNMNKFGLIGILVRVNDKLERLINLTQKNKEPKNESIEDSLKDIANYCIIGLMLLRNKWQ